MKCRYSFSLTKVHLQKNRNVTVTFFDITKPSQCYSNMKLTIAIFLNRIKTPGILDKDYQVGIFQWLLDLRSNRSINLRISFLFC